MSALRSIIEELSAPSLLFVYGTLKKGHSAHAQMKGAVFVGTATTASKYVVKDLSGGGIGIIPGGNDSVDGELYMVPREHLKRLDAYEDQEFRRSTVKLSDGLKAYAYLYFPV